MDIICSEEVCNSIASPKRDEDRVGLQKEILGSLFTFPQRSEEAPKRRYPVRVTPYQYRRPAVRIPEDSPKAQQSTIVESQIVKEGMLKTYALPKS